MKKTLTGTMILASVLILVVSCGKSDSSQSTNKHQQSTDSSLSTDNHQPSTINLVFNGNFEEGIESPDGWTTKNQFLNNVTGWATDESHTGKHSLKIENIGGTDAYWEGKPIIVDEPINAFEASIWTKTTDIETSEGKLKLVLDVYLRNGQGDEIKRRISQNISQMKDEWEQTKCKFLFAENIARIVPYLYYSGRGIAYADDLTIKASNIDSAKNALLFDSDINPFPKEVKIISDSNSKKTFEQVGPDIIMNSSFIPVKQEKIYKISGMFKSNNIEKSILFFGYCSFTKDKKFISSESVNYVSNTETELTAPCTEEDTTIYIKDGKNWNLGGDGVPCIAFDVDPSGNHADLPNFNLSSIGIDKISRDGQFWKVELSKPCGKNYPAKTKIREHETKGQFIYNCALGVHTPYTWTEYVGMIGKAEGFTCDDVFYPGTEYVKIVIVPNHGQSKQESLNFMNIKLEEFNF